MLSTIEVKTQAAKLRDALDDLGHPLKHSQGLEIIAKVEGYPDWNTQSADINAKQQRAEQYLDEMLEGDAQASYAKFTQRFEPKYLVGFSERRFLKDTQEIREDVGDYVRREYMGCLHGMSVPDDSRYPNRVRYVWRGFFEKSEVLITVGIYYKNETYYVCESRYR